MLYYSSYAYFVQFLKFRILVPNFSDYTLHEGQVFKISNASA